MEYLIREMRMEEYSILEEFLYEAIFQRDGEDLLPRAIIDEPSLRVYIDGFGLRGDDYCLCAEVCGKIVGAVWVRIVEGYGNVGGETPEFAVSLFKEFRGFGIGTDLMKRMMEYLKDKGYKKASLAVQKDNYALRMYLNVGFRAIDEDEEEYIMVCDLN